MVRVPCSDIREGHVTLDSDMSRYVARVLRCTLGSAIDLFDPEAGRSGLALVHEIGRHSVVVRVTSVVDAPPESHARILLQGIGKGAKLDHVVRQATELGATHIVPIITDRSVRTIAHPEREAQRLRAIALMACRQSHRSRMPRIDIPMPLEDALTLIPPSTVCVAFVPGAPRFEPYTLQSRAHAALVGPEGGFDPAELRAAEGAGFLFRSLGEHILRTETAAVSALTALVLAAAIT